MAGWLAGWLKLLKIKPTLKMSELEQNQPNSAEKLTFTGGWLADVENKANSAKLSCSLSWGWTELGN